MPDISDPTIPSVGAVGKSLFWYPTTIYQCNCDFPHITLVILTGFGNQSECPKCHKLYTNKGLTQTANGIDIVVDCIIPVKQDRPM